MKEDFTYCDEVTVLEESELANRNRLVTASMHIRCIDNAWIVPFCDGYEEYQGEVITDDYHIVSDVSSGSIYSDDQRICSEITEFDKCNEIIYLGSINICWGHYITDGIAKMWCLHNPEILSLIERGVKVAFSAEWQHVVEMPSTWRHLIDLLGGEKVEIIPIQKITYFNHIYIPSNSIYNTPQGRLYTKEFVDTIKELKNNALKAISGKTYDKLYFSRTHLKSNHGEFGERHIEKLFKKVGYKVLYPEELSFEQQVHYLSNARSVAGTMGSITHNFMFCKPDTEAIILRKAWYTNDFQYVINQAFDLNVTYIDCHLSAFTTDNPNLGPFFLYANDNVKRFLKGRFRVNVKNNFSTRDYMRYMRTCLRRADMKQRTESPEYYYQQLREELHNDNWKRNMLGLVQKILPESLYHKVVNQFVRIRR